MFFLAHNSYGVSNKKNSQLNLLTQSGDGEVTAQKYIFRAFIGLIFSHSQDANHNNIDHYPATASTSTDPYPNTQHVAQLQTLYEARGRKIESLQREIEEKDENYAKETRILNHKLILATG